MKQPPTYIYDVAAAPVRGMRTKPDPASLGPGEFPKIDDMRWGDDGVLRGRNGSTEVVDDAGLTGLTGRVLRGAGGPFITGDYAVVLIAISHYSALTVSRVYARVYTISTGTWDAAWTEVTASSGQFGDTRLGVPSYGNVQFQQVSDASGMLGVIVQSGNRSDGALLVNFDWDSGGSLDMKAIPIESVTAPLVAGAATPEPRMSAEVDVGGGAMAVGYPAENDTGGFITAAKTATSWGAGSFWSTTVSGGALTSGDWVHFRLLSAYEVFSGNQIILLFKTNNDAFLKSTIELDDATTGLVVIHDPNDATNPVNEMFESFVSGESGIRMAVFPRPPGVSLSQVRGVKITFDTNAAEIDGSADDQYFYIYGLCAGGFVPGGAEYAVAMHSTYSKTDSPVVVMTALDPTKNAGPLATLGSSIRSSSGWSGGWFYPRNSSVPSDFVLPIDPRVYYEYHVPQFAPDSETVNGLASASTGWADKYSIYRRDPYDDGTDYFHVTDVTVASWSGSAWQTTNSLFGSTSAWSKRATTYYADETQSADRDFSRRAPDDFNERVPPGQSMVVSGKRLYVASWRGQTSAVRAALDAVKVSEEGFPMRFRTVPRTFFDGSIDPVSGYEVPLPGEQVRKLYDVSASVVGNSDVYAMGDRGLYAMDLGFARRIASVGTNAPDSVHEKDGRVRFVGNDNLVFFMDSVLREVSKAHVQDVLDSVPAANRQYAVGVAHKGRYYLGICTNVGSFQGLGANYILVWNDAAGAWESLDFLNPSDTRPTDVSFWLPWNVNGDDALYFVNHYGCILELGVGATDNTSSTNYQSGTVTWEVHGRDFRDPEWAREVRVGDISVVAEDQASGTITTKRFCRTTGAVPTEGTGTINIDVSTAWAYRRDTGSETQARAGASDFSVQPRLNGTGQTVLRSIVADVSKVGLGGPDR